MTSQSTPAEITPPFKKQPLGPPGLEKKMDPRPLYKAKNYIGSEKLAGKIALVTGGDSGIGRSVCTLFAKEGADVVLTFLPEEREDAQETLNEIQKIGRQGMIIETDLTAKEVIPEIVAKVVKKFGRIDILVNNAAFQQHLADIDELDFEQFYQTFDVNLFSIFKMVKAALPYMNEGAVIINTGSILGYVGDANLIDYSASKGAIHTFTKSLAKALSKRKIRVNSVAPGPVWTPLNPAERDEEEVKNFGKDTVFGRPAQPEEIAPAYVYLASDVTGSYITGETINLFGDVSGAN